MPSDKFNGLKAEYHKGVIRLIRPNRLEQVTVHPEPGILIGTSRDMHLPLDCDEVNRELVERFNGQVNAATARIALKYLYDVLVDNFTDSDGDVPGLVLRARRLLRENGWEIAGEPEPQDESGDGTGVET